MDTKINPTVTRVSIGKKELREIEILPLSVADQFKLSDMVAEGIAAMSAIGQSAGDVEFVGVVLDTLKRNLGKILGMITRETGERRSFLNMIRRALFGRGNGKRLLRDITSNQAEEIIKIIYKNNYEQFVKKLKGLLKDPEKSGLLGRLSQIF